MLKQPSIGNFFAILSVSMLSLILSSNVAIAQTDNGWVKPVVMTPEQLQRDDSLKQSTTYTKSESGISKEELRFNQGLEKISPIVQIGLPQSQVRKGAPSRYVVKSGDTTWRVANLFLSDPWLWPSLRGNPYPRVVAGQTLIMKRDKGLVRVIALAAPSSRSAVKRSVRPVKKALPVMPPVNTVEQGLSVEKRSPRAIEMPLDRQPQYEPIEMKSILNFLPKKNIVLSSDLDRVASIDKPLDNKYVAVAGDYIYLNNFKGSVGDVMDVYSRGLELTPENQDPKFEPLVYQELTRVGKLKVEKVNPSGNGRALAVITRADEELPPGLLVLPPRDNVIPNMFEPKRPEQMIKPRVLAISNGLGGLRGSSLLINKGAEDGVEVGHVFSVIKSRLGDQAEIELWDANVEGLIMVVDVYDHYAYTVVLSTPSLITPGTNLVPAQEK